MTSLRLRQRLPALLALCLSCSVVAESHFQTGEEAAIRALVERYFSAYAREDLEAIGRLWSDKSPDLAQTKATLKEFFSINHQIETKNYRFRKIKVEEDHATALVTMEVTAVDPQTNKPQVGLGKRSQNISFVKEAGEWKIQRDASREIVKSRKPKSSTTLLAMGNPEIGGQTISRSKNVLMSASFEPLPDAERMVKELGQMYGAKARVYVRAEAREEALKAESSNYRILQLATHGVINNASPMYSYVVLAQGNNAQEDGLLEAWEIMQLDLRADLAVLSACETARGRIGAGEGVIGLAWALFVAGCPTTMVSQWKVESSSTTELMLAFHRNLQSGTGKSEALRHASLKLMADKTYNHPFYWAGFIVVGDPQ
jgi:ketosteroid isomerase-like protein